jgi:hypothetical protein
MTGEISPEQYYMMDFEKGGSLDPLSGFKAEPEK